MKLLIDADFLIGSIFTEDAHHIRSVTLFKELKYRGDIFFILNSVVQEVATVISHKVGMNEVKSFIKEYPSMGFTEIPLSRDVELRAWEVFLTQTKKGCSFVDCANLAVIEKYNLDGVLSFDEFYPKKLRKTES